MIDATSETGMMGVEKGPSTPNRTSFSEVSRKGKVIVPVEMSLEQIGALASQALSSPSAGSDHFIFPEPPSNFLSTSGSTSYRTSSHLPVHYAEEMHGIPYNYPVLHTESKMQKNHQNYPVLHTESKMQEIHQKDPVMQTEQKIAKFRR